MTDAKTATTGAAIGLVGGIVLGGLLWWLWFGGQGLPPDDVRGRVISFTAVTCLFTTLANALVAVFTHAVLRGDHSPALRLHGVLWGGLSGCLLGVSIGFVGMYIVCILSQARDGMWILGAALMASVCGLAEIVLGAATGAYLAYQLKA